MFGQKDCLLSVHIAQRNASVTAYNDNGANATWMFEFNNEKGNGINAIYFRFDDGGAIASYGSLKRQLADCSLRPIYEYEHSRWRIYSLAMLVGNDSVGDFRLQTVWKCMCNRIKGGNQITPLRLAFPRERRPDGLNASLQVLDQFSFNYILLPESQPHCSCFQFEPSANQRWASNSSTRISTHGANRELHGDPAYRYASSNDGTVSGNAISRERHPRWQQSFNDSNEVPSRRVGVRHSPPLSAESTGRTSRPDVDRTHQLQTDWL